MSVINLDRSVEGLMDVASRRLQGTAISAENPGGVVRLLLAIVNDIAKEYYDTLKTVHAQAFLSSAIGENLDAIGVMMACSREENESDDNYRFRISKQTLTTASANETAVRLATLSVPGVIDCILKPWTHGTGSGSIFVITQDPYPSDSFIQKVQDAVNKVIAFGNKVFVTVPKPIPLEIGVKLIFNKKASNTDQQLVVSNARQVLKDLVASKTAGSSLVINEIISKIMDVSPNIYDVEIYKFFVNNRPALLVNQETQWDQRFVESVKPDALMVS